MFRPNDQFYSRQWNFPAIDMERAWDINAGASSDVIVAVLDGGVAFRNALIRFEVEPFRLEPNGPIYPGLGVIDVPFAAAPDLGDTSRFVSPRDFIWDDDLPLDFDGHGTHVAGTIGQATNNTVGAAGMAFNVRIMPVKVISEVWDDIFGSPNFGTDDLVARGIRYAADNGAHIINMSIGRENGGPAPAIEAAVAYAVSRGVFVAIAAGNDGSGANRPNRSAEFAPRIDGAVAVAAVGRSLDRAYYSTTGSFVEIAAPGRRSAPLGRRRDPPADGRPGPLADLPARSGPLQGAALRRVPVLLHPGHVDGDAARLGIRGAAAAAGDHRAGGDRSGDEAVRDRPRADGTRQRLRRRPDQPAGDTARPRAGAMTAAGRLMSATALARPRRPPAGRRRPDRTRALEPAGLRHGRPDDLQRRRFVRRRARHPSAAPSTAAACAWSFPADRTSKSARGASRRTASGRLSPRPGRSSRSASR